jgi:hypothetical protein
MLRQYWVTHRHPLWLVPATGRDYRRAALAFTGSREKRRGSVGGAGTASQTRDHIECEIDVCLL